MEFRALYLSFEGRINRKTYWTSLFGVMGMSIGSSFIAQILDEVVGAQGNLAVILVIIMTLPLIWFQLAITAKRWHDRDKSAWWLLLDLLPVVGWVWRIVELGFLVGTTGDNRFGADPNADTFQTSVHQNSNRIQLGN